jgi:hypothetical protein
MGERNNKMACFTDLRYADRSYQFVITLANAAGINPVGLGCYSAMNDSGKLYQFYISLATIAGYESPVTQNCFEQLTEDAQMNLTNEALASAFAS